MIGNDQKMAFQSVRSVILLCQHVITIKLRGTSCFSHQ